MAARRPRKRAFTIVEVLVVISILGLLLGVLLPALGGMRRKSHKTVEMNSLKQVSHAWMLYANHNNGAALPGFLTSEVQARWKVRYEYPDRKPIPPALPNGGYDTADPNNNIAGPWTWRLMVYLDHAHEIVHAHHDEDFTMLEISNDPEEAREIAYEPGFGYNGYYIGGMWSMEGGVNGTARYEFYDHCRSDDPTQTRVSLAIPTSLAQIRRSSELIAFCSTTEFEGPGQVRRLEDDRPGFHLAVPPRLGQIDQWGIDQGTGGSSLGFVTYAKTTYVPIGRHTGAAAVLHADGHLESHTVDALTDIRRWIDQATDRTYQHDVCPPPLP